MVSRRLYIPGSFAVHCWNKFQGYNFCPVKWAVSVKKENKSSVKKKSESNKRLILYQRVRENNTQKLYTKQNNSLCNTGINFSIRQTRHFCNTLGGSQ